MHASASGMSDPHAGRPSAVEGSIVAVVWSALGRACQRVLSLYNISPDQGESGKQILVRQCVHQGVQNVANALGLLGSHACLSAFEKDGGAQRSAPK